MLWISAKSSSTGRVPTLGEIENRALLFSHFGPGRPRCFKPQFPDGLLEGSGEADRDDCGDVLPLAQTAVHFPDTRSSDALYFRGVILFKVVSYQAESRRISTSPWRLCADSASTPSVRQLFPVSPAREGGQHDQSSIARGRFRLPVCRDRKAELPSFPKPQC